MVALCCLRRDARQEWWQQLVRAVGMARMQWEGELGGEGGG
jgi:hypothetical protein